MRRLPSLRWHKAANQFVVTLTGAATTTLVATAEPPTSFQSRFAPAAEAQASANALDPRQAPMASAFASPASAVRSDAGLMSGRGLY